MALDLQKLVVSRSYGAYGCGLMMGTIQVWNQHYVQYGTVIGVNLIVGAISLKRR
jgi:hypothetical protein